jgi:hypothetical protein
LLLSTNLAHYYTIISIKVRTLQQQRAKKRFFAFFGCVCARYPNRKLVPPPPASAGVCA